MHVPVFVVMLNSSHKKACGSFIVEIFLLNFSLSFFQLHNQEMYIMLIVVFSCMENDRSFDEVYLHMKNN